MPNRSAYFFTINADWAQILNKPPSFPADLSQAFISGSKAGIVQGTDSILDTYSITSSNGADAPILDGAHPTRIAFPSAGNYLIMALATAVYDGPAYPPKNSIVLVVKVNGVIPPFLPFPAFGIARYTPNVAGDDAILTPIIGVISMAVNDYIELDCAYNPSPGADSLELDCNITIFKVEG